MISNFVDDNTRHEISIDAGFTYKAKSMVEVLIGNNKYKFFSMENRSWLADGQNGKQLIKDMKNGARVKVKSVSSRGTKITDTFSLIGFTKALAAIDKACS
jgi:invasion protein IalB